ncbi:hypothetical protein BMF94_5848 [Rhodotorula taiwanensis]|uniref:Amino acid permease/ SLC12A domain-containing protein n=1 Tax=Rhodotorula taiwanensis TaxID=741276 RepID=A0A2S5B320_9BASI|nr:hypothetical protein BMF94_5848 [Rhodotorula taiwanensis]
MPSHKADVLSVQEIGTNDFQSKDAAKLGELGYEQELRREWSTLESFAISFSIISICTGITTSFELGLTNGGPAVMSIGWIFVSFMTMFVALSMAEVVSSVPTSGGPYHWAALLSRPQHSAFVSYLTGWFNLLGQAAVTTGIVFGNANLIAAVASQYGFVSTPSRLVGISAGLLVFGGVINSLGIRVLAWVNRFSVVLHSCGVFSICVALLVKAPTHRTAREVFATFNDSTGDPTWSVRASPAYVALTGILMSQFTITGFDASAHMAEETRNAGKAAPKGVIMSVGVSAIFGFFYLVSLLFCIQSFGDTIASPTGQPVIQIMSDVFGKNGGTAAMSIIIACVTLCGTCSLTSNSRMFYAFSRDSGIPRWFDHVDKRTQSPLRTIWLAVVLAFCLTLPALGSVVAYTAVTSIATIGLYISYAIPIAVGVAFDQKRFQQVRGPFTLGKFSRPVALIATGYVIFITICFCLPTINPVDTQTLNYAPVAVGIVLVYVIVSWFGWARHWFHGPRQTALGKVEGANRFERQITNDKADEKDSSDQTSPTL